MARSVHPRQVKAEGILSVAEHPERSMAFAMGHQERLGVESWVRLLDPAVLRFIADLVN